MKDDRRMMVMEVKIATLSKLNAKDTRKDEALAIRTRFPHKIPVIVTRFDKDVELPHLEKEKYLVPDDITMTQFQSIIRSRLKIGPTQAIYFIVNNRTLVNQSMTLGEAYHIYAPPNGYLRITYASQEVFG